MIKALDDGPRPMFNLFLEQRESTVLAVSALFILIPTLLPPTPTLSVLIENITQYLKNNNNTLYLRIFTGYRQVYVQRKMAGVVVNKIQRLETERTASFRVSPIPI